MTARHGMPTALVLVLALALGPGSAHAAGWLAAYPVTPGAQGAPVVAPLPSGAALVATGNRSAVILLDADGNVVEVHGFHVAAEIVAGHPWTLSARSPPAFRAVGRPFRPPALRRPDAPTICAAPSIPCSTAVNFSSSVQCLGAGAALAPGAAAPGKPTVLRAGTILAAQLRPKPRGAARGQPLTTRGAWRVEGPAGPDSSRSARIVRLVRRALPPARWPWHLATT